MHDIRSIRENAAAFDQGLRNRGLEPLVRASDRPRRPAQGADLRPAGRHERRNALSKEIGQAKAAKDEARAQELMAEVARLKETCRRSRRRSARPRRRSTRRSPPFPTCPKEDVPVGAGRARQRGAPPLRHAPRLSNAQAAFRDRRGHGPDGFRDGREALGLALRGSEGRAGAAGAGARPVHDRPAHDRARLYGGGPAAAGARRGHVRHRAVAEIRGRPVLAFPGNSARADRCAQRLEGVSRAGCHRQDDQGHPLRLIPTAEVRSPISCAIDPRPRRNCRSASPRSRPASAPRPAPPGAIRAACCASTSS